MTSTERVEDEIFLVDKHFELLEKEIERAADDIAQDPAFWAMVRGSDHLGNRSIVLSSLVKLDLQHLEVFDRNGVSFGHEHHASFHNGTRFQYSDGAERNRGWRNRNNKIATDPKWLVLCLVEVAKRFGGISW